MRKIERTINFTYKVRSYSKRKDNEEIRFYLIDCGGLGGGQPLVMQPFVIVVGI
jgi:hypothetical protein